MICDYLIDTWSLRMMNQNPVTQNVHANQVVFIAWRCLTDDLLQKIYFKLTITIIPLFFDTLYLSSIDISWDTKTYKWQVLQTQITRFLTGSNLDAFKETSISTTFIWHLSYLIRYTIWNCEWNLYINYIQLSKHMRRMNIVE